MIRSGCVGLLDLLLPAGCVVCRDWIPTTSGRTSDAPLVCIRCRTRLRRPSWPRCQRCHHPRGTGRVERGHCGECAHWPPELTSARAAFELTGPADDLVHALKYEGWSDVAGFMAETMASELRRAPSPDSLPLPYDQVVPVPTTRRRERSRGYNQARLLAEGVAALLEIPLLDALERRDAHDSQTALSPEQRRSNVRGAFAVTGAAVRHLCGRHVLLVDDVLTTGATSSEAAGSLAAAGAERVTLITFARALAGRVVRAA